MIWTARPPRSSLSELNSQLASLGFTTKQRIWLRMYFSLLSKTLKRNKQWTKRVLTLLEHATGELAEAMTTACLSASEVRDCMSPSIKQKQYLLALDLCQQDLDRWMRTLSAFSSALRRTL